MPRLFIGNYDFEHLLADPDFTLPEHLQYFMAHNSVSWIAIATADDAIWLPLHIDEQIFASLAKSGFATPATVYNISNLSQADNWELSPWGWTSRTIAAQQRLNPRQQVPDLDVVRQVNSRSFAYAAETKRNLLPVGAARIASWQDLEQQINQFAVPEQRWVIKSDFGMAARERLLGRGNNIPVQQKNWIQKKLRSEGVMFFEPWLHKITEVGLQFQVPALGKPVLRGVLPLLTDENGLYRGSRIGPETLETAASEWTEAITLCSEIAQEIQQLGYFGPLGFDVMQYRDQHGEIKIRFLQDINARWTMGRLTLGLCRLLKPHEYASWLHLPMDIATVSLQLAQFEPDSITAICTSPTQIAGQSITQSSWLLIAERETVLHQAENRLIALETGIL